MSPSKMLLCVAVFACLLFAGAVHAQEEVDESNVIIMTGSNFQETLDANPGLFLMEFYAPWCGHCKKLKPEYAKAADILIEEGIRIGKMDCTEEDNKEVCGKYGVQGYPTLKLSLNKDKDPMDYDGPREAQGIVDTLRKWNQPGATLVTDQAEVEAIIAKNDAVIVAFAESLEAVPVFTGVADENKIKQTYVVSTVALPGTSIGDIWLYVSFEENPIQYTEDQDDELALLEWILFESFPVFGQIGPENYKEYVAKNLPIIWTFVSPAADNFDAVKTAMTDACKTQRGKISCVWLDAVQWASHMEFMGVAAEPIPALVYENSETKKRYLFQTTEWDGTTSEPVATFFQDVADGKVAENVKSEPVPESQDEPVIVIVGKNFEAEVTNKNADVLLEFYAPWCGHCKSLAPVWTELAEKYAEDDSIIIAKVDATKNDIPGVEVQGFPTIYLFPADGSAPKKVESGRTLDDLAAYVEENRSEVVTLHSEL